MNSSKIYQSPLKVYLALGALALWGIISGFHLPISLFPNSSKPRIIFAVDYENLSASAFLNVYGRNIENSLEQMSTGRVQVDKVIATYSSSHVSYEVDFKWGTNSDQALEKVREVASTYEAEFPLEIRNSARVFVAGQNSGFLAVSFYSSKQTLDQLYEFLRPQLLAPAHRVHSAAEVDLWNPHEKEIRITLNPEKMAALQLFPNDVASALLPQLQGSAGGDLTVGLNQLDIQMPAAVHNLSELKRAMITTRSGQTVYLEDIAHVDLGTPMGNSQSIRTSGIPSVIFFARPKPGSNLKAMADQLVAIVKHASRTWPSDIHYKVLVDPSQFIRSAVLNVAREVAIAALLAVLVLFLFIGNLRNVITAAIEIPLSIILAFILMRLTGVNLNLISLGGLALSAGMNVDGSVVVMENIFRHFDEAMENRSHPLTQMERVRILTQAVNEVKLPIIASTIASIVVFLPLAFTSQLTNAILGDLALAVIFSHAFSAVVALILVPTVRLQLMSKGSEKSKPSFLEPIFSKVENAYGRYLARFLNAKNLQRFTYAALVGALLVVGFLILPHLKREIIGKPDSDWMTMFVSTQGNTLIAQMDSESSAIEAKLKAKLGPEIRYTFTQTWDPNSSFIMVRLRHQSHMRQVWTKMENLFPNSPEFFYHIGPFNPSQLRIPNPPDFQISVHGPVNHDRNEVARDIVHLLEEHHAFDRISTEPNVSIQHGIVMGLNQERWGRIEKANLGITPSDIADISRVATLGREIWQMPIQGHLVPIDIAFPQNRVKTVADLEALPMGINGKLLPLKAFAQFRIRRIQPDRRRENGNDLILVTGQENRGNRHNIPEAQLAARKLVQNWIRTHGRHHSSAITFDDPAHDLTHALHELATAVALSILLIFLTMVFEFGDVVNSLLVLVAVPLGFIGALTALFVFRSTLSLNSALGLILLNGITVANSIILVDFLKQLVERGMSQSTAAVQSATKRLRPILMTSLTTGLGMMPIALGFGDGGRILQPLGITVVCGLGFSMLTTLFIVPSLQVTYLEWRQKRQGDRGINPGLFHQQNLDWAPAKPSDHSLPVDLI